ncbi:binding-protein-dependent transport system inner membrane protein [Gracilibacillus halophilus YIM-C55.5]|uniref:Binding-protein-dependent transport system inner membrane protein n=1 Tax=Gracilibacillus halophilus YIM-C55.5 TaxID=1308866 RepID=N4WCU2_9BACI|nr:iron ABC transporter permease [Gracilibacillus halophilus]ENH98073.1 binding-protein-dependent transport system inner membrane protein [Gracilibacillus halophilus YIM-C55.5]
MSTETTKQSRTARLVSDLRQFWSEPWFAILTMVLAGAILLFIVVPVFAVLLKSFGMNENGFTLDYYQEFFSRTYYFDAIINSLSASILSTIIVVFLSVSISLYVTRSSSFVSKFYRGAALLPLVAPPFIFSLSLIILFGRNGVITNIMNHAIGVEFSIYGFWGVVISQVLGYFPIGYMLVESTMRNMSPSLEHASSDLGASQWKTLRKITLPLSQSGITKAGLLVFVMALADFSNPLIIGGGKPFLASEAYLLVVGQQNLEQAAVLGVFLIIPSLIIFIFQTYFLKDSGLETISGESGASNAPLSRKVKSTVMTINTIFVAFIILMFVMVILGAFVKIIGINNTFTLEHFKNRNGWDSLYTSVFVSFIAAILAATIGMLQGYLFARKPIPGKKVLEFLTLFGLAVPGTVMGIGYVLIFNGPPFFLTGTVLLIVLNMTFRKIGVGLEASISKMHQIDSSMEEASSDLGSGPYRTFGKIIVPLLSPAFIAGFVYTFMTAMVSISSVIFLIAPGTNLAAVYILNLAEQARVGMASAMSFILIVIVLSCMGLLKYIEKKTGVSI